MTRRSHGDGRRMTLAEAIERRARMIRVHGSLEEAHDHGYGPAVHEDGDEPQDRDWNCWSCVPCWENDRGDEPVDAVAPEDVGLLDGIPVAMCSRCRGAAS